MITSSLGLAEVPHVPAPAGLAELAAATRRYAFPDVTDLPVLLVPGVRSGVRDADPESIGRSDIMRGEETLCVGLVSLGLLPTPATVLNLGSHWKAIRIDADGRVAGSITSLSGEMIHATQAHTILTSDVPPDRPDVLDEHWVQAGMREQGRSGLARALFCVRLLGLSDRGGTPAERMAFLVGAFIAADLDALTAGGSVGRDRPVALAGSAALAAAWQRALAEASVPATVLTEDQIERALLAGLAQILGAPR
jgi:2-dehydro-3-deoxygalactonokinase